MLKQPGLKRFNEIRVLLSLTTVMTIKQTNVYPKQKRQYVDHVIHVSTHYAAV